jgi:transcription antitermination factor NusG
MPVYVIFPKHFRAAECTLRSASSNRFPIHSFSAVENYLYVDADECDKVDFLLKALGKIVGTVDSMPTPPIETPTSFNKGDQVKITKSEQFDGLTAKVLRVYANRKAVLVCLNWFGAKSVELPFDYIKLVK